MSEPADKSKAAELAAALRKWAKAAFSQAMRRDMLAAADLLEGKR